MHLNHENKNTIPENKIDELKALIARSILIRIEQKKIEAKLHELQNIMMKNHSNRFMNQLENL